MSSVPTPIAAALLRVAWVSVTASVLVSVTFALAIVGLVRGGEMRSTGRGAAALAYATLAVFALTVFGASVIYGLILLGHKS
jgi:hypothetical protein